MHSSAGRCGPPTWLAGFEQLLLGLCARVSCARKCERCLQVISVQISEQSSREMPRAHAPHVGTRSAAAT